MPKQIVDNVPGAIPSLPVFSQAVVSRGTVYVSGSVGCDNEFNIVGGVQQQVTAALDNMKRLLEAAGSDFEHILKVNIYLTHIARDFQIFNDIYLTYFSDLDRLPARTCIGVAALPMGAFVEVDCVAELASED